MTVAADLDHQLQPSIRRRRARKIIVAGYMVRYHIQRGKAAKAVQERNMDLWIGSNLLIYFRAVWFSHLSYIVASGVEHE